MALIRLTMRQVSAGIAAFGIFARCRKFGIDGLIQLNDLGPDNWKYNQKTQSIVGSNSGIVLHLGQAIKVQIVSVNIPARQLNLCPAEPLVDVSKKRKIKKRTTKNGKPRTRKKQKRENKRR